MLVIKDLYSDISDCFWLFYGSKYKAKLSLRQLFFGIPCHAQLTVWQESGAGTRFVETRQRRIESKYNDKL